MQQSNLTLYLGDYEVVEVVDGNITLRMGAFHTTIDTHSLPHLVKRGDKLPLYTTVPYALARSS